MNVFGKINTSKYTYVYNTEVHPKGKANDKLDPNLYKEGRKPGQSQLAEIKDQQDQKAEEGIPQDPE